MRILLCFAAATSFATAATAQSTETLSENQQLCDALAGHPEYPGGHSGPGVWSADMDAVTAIAACLAAVAEAPDHMRMNFQLARALHVGDRRADSVPYYEKAIELGDPVAMVNLGWVYQTGRGVEQSSAKYFELTKRAADTGYYRGVYAHAEAYWHGYGTEVNDETALALFRQSAADGYGLAMERIADSYEQGRGVEVDIAAAIQWRDQAGNAGVPHAWRDIGEYYFDGNGVEADATQGCSWNQKAADAGDAIAQANVGWCYQNGEGVAQDQSRARDLYQTASDGGVLWATRNLAEMYYYGEGGDVDYGAAHALWDIMGASSDAEMVAEANFSIGWLFREGDGVEQDYEQALAYYKKAAELGHAGAHESIGHFYAEGYGVERDFTEAFNWRRKGAELGSHTAMYGMAVQLFTSQGTPRDDAKMIELLTLLVAEAEGDSQSYALNLLGIAHELGRGVTADVPRALELYRAAQEAGDANAIHNIAEIFASDDYGMADYDAAFEIYSDLYENSDDPSYGALGALYEHGKGVAVDLARATELYDQGVEAGEPGAMWRLALLYAAGKGVTEDDAKALALFDQAIAEPDHISVYHKAEAYERGLFGPDGAAQAAELHEAALMLGRNEGLIRDPAGWDAATVEALQERLAARDHYAGPLDGQMSDATMAAMQALFNAGN